MVDFLHVIIFTVAYPSFDLMIVGIMVYLTITAHYMVHPYNAHVIHIVNQFVNFSITAY